jgi:hypothetical protein
MQSARAARICRVKRRAHGQYPRICRCSFGDRIAPFVVAYASKVGLGMSELIDAVLMMALPRRMCGTAALVR